MLQVIMRYKCWRSLWLHDRKYHTDLKLTIVISSKLKHNQFGSKEIHYNGNTMQIWKRNRFASESAAEYMHLVRKKVLGDHAPWILYENYQKI